MRRVLAALITSSLLVLPATAAYAQKPTLTYTIIERNGLPSSLEVVDPCLGPATATTTTSLFMVHVTEFVAGPNIEAVHVTYTTVGTYVLDPDDPALPTYSGRFLDHGSGNFNRGAFEDSVTFKTIAHAPDGSHLRSDVHFQFAVTPQGVTHSIYFQTIDCPS
jgi:hypothetical protein